MFSPRHAATHASSARGNFARKARAFFANHILRGFIKAHIVGVGLGLLLIQCPVMVRDPQIQIGFGAPRKLGHDLAFADDRNDGHVNKIIPIGHGLFPCNIATVIQPEQVLMDDNMFEQAGIAAGLGKLDIDVGTGLVQFGLA